MSHVQPEQTPVQVIRSHAPPLFVALLIAGAVLLTVRMNITLTEQRVGETFKAIIIRQDGRFVLAGESYAGLSLAHEVVANVSIRGVVDEYVAGSVIRTVRDEVSWTITPSDQQSLSAESKGFLSDTVRINAMMSEGIPRERPRLKLGSLAADGPGQRTRISTASLYSLAWLLGILACFGASLLIWGVPRLRAARRAAAIANGACPGCGLPMGTLKSRTCPQCKCELSPEEFNAIIKHWRK